MATRLSCALQFVSRINEPCHTATKQQRKPCFLWRSAVLAVTQALDEACVAE